jgi:hypothetical protein
MSIRFVGRFSIKAGKAERFEEIVAETGAQARTEDGIEECSFYMNRQDCIDHEQYKDGGRPRVHTSGAARSRPLTVATMQSR